MASDRGKQMMDSFNKVIPDDELRSQIVGCILSVSQPAVPDIQRYIFRWNRPGMLGRKGQTCKVIARGKMNSCSIEFEDGFRAVTSRNALRKVRDGER